MKRQARFSFEQDRAGEWRWRLVAANGKIVAVGESHLTRDKAVRAAEGVQRAAREAQIAQPAPAPLSKPISKRVIRPVRKPAVKKASNPTRKPAVKAVRR